MTKIDKLISQRKNKIASLEKRRNRAFIKLIRAEDRAEERIEKTLGNKYRKLYDECVSYNIGLERLMIDKRRERNASK